MLEKRSRLLQEDALAVWLCELAEKINAEMKARGWVE